MSISIVIPAYNEEKYIEKCLESIGRQTQKPSEVIVVDNNCTDNTIALAQKFNVKVVKETKQGRSLARNCGFNQAKSDIIARCDADVIVPPDWVKRIDEDFQSRKIDALTGPIEFYDLLFGQAVFSQIYIKTMNRLQRGKNTLNGLNMAITKKIWERIKNQACTDDSLVHEDIDLALHINQVGGKIYYDKKLVVRSSGRRIVNKPFSFFIEYPYRTYKTLSIHKNTILKN